MWLSTDPYPSGSPGGVGPEHKPGLKIDCSIDENADRDACL
jgi:hypothetical protein